MEYYLLKLNDTIKKTVRPQLFNLKSPIIEYDMLDVVNVGEYDKKNIEITDVLMQPFPMVSLELKDLLINEEKSVEIKALQLFSNDEERIPLLYFIVNPIRVDCLDESVHINPNGSINEIIINKSKLPKEKIFMIDRISERKIIISGSIAERILKKGYIGVGIEKINIV